MPTLEPIERLFEQILAAMGCKTTVSTQKINNTYCFSAPIQDTLPPTLTENYGSFFLLMQNLALMLGKCNEPQINATFVNSSENAAQSRFKMTFREYTDLLSRLDAQARISDAVLLRVTEVQRGEDRQFRQRTDSIAIKSKIGSRVKGDENVKTKSPAKSNPKAKSKTATKPASAISTKAAAQSPSPAKPPTNPAAAQISDKSAAKSKARAVPARSPSKSKLNARPPQRRR
jgi:hypothetical protein